MKFPSVITHLILYSNSLTKPHVETSKDKTLTLYHLNEILLNNINLGDLLQNI